MPRVQRPGVGLRRPLPASAVADAAQEVFERGPHLLVLVGVDAGVHDRIGHGQKQQPAF